MARIRSIKPEFWRSPSTAAASPRARLLYIAMWNWCDDYGVGEWTPRELLGFAFPNDEDVTNAEFQSLCTEVAACFGTEFYVVRGRRFYYIPAWDDHQKNERRATGKYPKPDVPEASPDQEFSGVAEKRGTSVRNTGDTASGTGNREQGNREQGTGESAPSVLSELFETCWSDWPRKTDKAEAKKRFAIAAKKIGHYELAGFISAFGHAYAATTEKQFVPGLGTWLNRERWTDEMPTASTPRDTRQTPTERAAQTLTLATEIDMKGLST